jgi:hypothetical protein
MNTELDKLIRLLEKDCPSCNKRVQAGVATAAVVLGEIAALGLLAGTAAFLTQLGRTDLAQLVKNWSPVSRTELSEEDRVQIQWASTWAQQDAAAGTVNAWQTQIESIGWNPAMADEAWSEATTWSKASADRASDPCQWLQKELARAVTAQNKLVSPRNWARGNIPYMGWDNYTEFPEAGAEMVGNSRRITALRQAILKYCSGGIQNTNTDYYKSMRDSDAGAPAP